MERDPIRLERSEKPRSRRTRFRTVRAKLRAIARPLIFRAKLAAAERPVVISRSGQVIESVDELFQHHARELGTSASSLWRWVSQFEKFGVDGLKRRKRSDRGFSRLRGPALIFIYAKCVEGANAVWRAHARTIYEELMRIWPGLYPDGSAPPSYATVRRLVRSLTSAVPRRRNRPDEKMQP